MLNNCEDSGDGREAAVSTDLLLPIHVTNNLPIYFQELSSFDLDLLQNRVRISLYGLVVLDQFFIYGVGCFISQCTELITATSVIVFEIMFFFLIADLVSSDHVHYDNVTILQLIVRTIDDCESGFCTVL